MGLVRQIGIAGLGVGVAMLASSPASTLAGASSRPSRTPSAARIAIAPDIHIPRMRPAAGPFGGYTPAQLRAAYFENPLLKKGIDGKGTSIAIVDSFGSPTIRHDLAKFDSTFRLRSANLTIIHPAGSIPKFQPTAIRLAWAEETTLDVEWAHAMAPAAHLVLVETPTSENEGTSGFPQIEKAEKYVIAHHLAGVISQSFGATEETFPKGTLRPLRGAYLQAAQRKSDITVLSASGDGGATDLKSNMSGYYPRPVTSWPASDPLVTAVGGLDLNLDSHGRRRGVPDQVWNDPSPPPTAGGGGLSIDFGRPAFQNGVKATVGSHRGVPDISMSASCSHAVAVFTSFQGPSWDLICGTSEATPLFAGIIALADQVAGHPIGPINGFLYQLAARHDHGIVDVTHGDNTVVVAQGGKEITVQGWAAVKGYDLASGVGTINASLFVPELAALAKKARG